MLVVLHYGTLAKKITTIYFVKVMTKVTVGLSQTWNTAFLNDVTIMS